MKEFRFIAMLLVVVTMVSSCDFVRSILGKPTSKDIARMKIEAEQQVKKQRQIDSLKQISLSQEQDNQEKEQSKIENTTLDRRYYVVLGSFKVENNADKLLAALSKDGYKPQRIDFKNGYDVISVASTDDYGEAHKILKNLRYRSYIHYPDDAWVYDSTRHLHK